MNIQGKTPLLAIAFVCTNQVWAAETTLGGFGQTQLQQDTGDAVQFTCGGFVAEGADPTIPLFATCRAMVHTANDLAGNAGPSRDSLGLTEDELAASLQQIATEEFAATESMAKELASTRTVPVLTRLVELRAGASGISFNGLLPESGQQIASTADSGSVTSPSDAPLRGGAAGDGDMAGPWGGFVNFNYGTGDVDETDRSNGFDFDSYNVTVGLDYRFTHQFVAGVALNYFDIETDFDTSPTVSGGGVDADGWGGALYATYYEESFYVDASAGYATTDYDVTRTIAIPSNTSIPAITETATATPDSDDFTLGVGAGYYFDKGALSWGPYFRGTYRSVDVSSYQESGAELSGLNLRVEGEEWESMTTVLGLQFSYASSQEFGVLLPYGRLGWIHEFENDSVDTSAVYVDDPRGNVLLAITDDPDEDYAELGLGLSAVFEGGLMGFASYDTVLGLDDVTSHQFSLGIRWEM